MLRLHIYATDLHVLLNTQVKTFYNDAETQHMHTQTLMYMLVYYCNRNAEKHRYELPHEQRYSQWHGLEKWMKKKQQHMSCKNGPPSVIHSILPCGVLVIVVEKSSIDDQLVMLWLLRPQDMIHIIFILIKPFSGPPLTSIYIHFVSPFIHTQIYQNSIDRVTHIHAYFKYCIYINVFLCHCLYSILLNPHVHARAQRNRHTRVVTWRLKGTWTAPRIWRNAAWKKHFQRKFQQGPNKLLQLWLIKPTTRPFCLLTHKLSLLSPRLSPTYDPCSIKPFHLSPPIKSIIIAGIGSRQITAVDGQVGSG